VDKSSRKEKRVKRGGHGRQVQERKRENNTMKNETKRERTGGGMRRVGVRKKEGHEKRWGETTGEKGKVKWKERGGGGDGQLMAKKYLGTD